MLQKYISDWLWCGCKRRHKRGVHWWLRPLPCLASCKAWHPIPILPGKNPPHLPQESWDRRWVRWETCCRRSKSKWWQTTRQAEVRRKNFSIGGDHLARRPPLQWRHWKVASLEFSGWSPPGQEADQVLVRCGSSIVFLHRSGEEEMLGLGRRWAHFHI